VLEDLAQKLQVITKQVENGVQLMGVGRFVDTPDSSPERNPEKSAELSLERTGGKQGQRG
ncbi:MAG: hypothetical protein M3Q45_10585, partial [Chloroflexota bacterium]|nr:hypothetical protein [Chloroflexota bacterium]